MEQLSAVALKAWLDDSARPKPVLVDVREPCEFEHCRIEGALLLPMSSVPSRMQELEPDAYTVLICHHGMRSLQVGMFLQQQGFSRLYNLSGGVAAWAAQVDPAMPTY